MTNEQIEIAEVEATELKNLMGEFRKSIDEFNGIVGKFFEIDDQSPKNMIIRKIDLVKAQTRIAKAIHFSDSKSADYGISVKHSPKKGFDVTAKLSGAGKAVISGVDDESIETNTEITETLEF